MKLIQNDALAPTGSACPEKATDLFYVTHHAAPWDLSGPYLTEGDAELSLASTLCPGAVVSRRAVEALDERTHALAVRNGTVVRAFASGRCQEPDHE
nr:hypothetical protein [Pseudomonas sp. dw_358]